MAKEIRGISNSAATLYAHIRNSSGQVWNASTFEAYTAGNYSTYDLAMTEDGDSAVYTVDFPTAITTGGTYEYYVYKQAGGSPAEGDNVVTTGKIDWTGSTSVTAGAGAMTGSDWQAYVLGHGFKRTDKDTQLYEATTDTIQILRRRFSFDEAHAETTSTDTITVDGDFKIAIESDLGLLRGIIMEDSTNAHELIQVSKDTFDNMYSDHNVTNDRGYPKHFAVYDSNIYIGPIPDAVTYSYRISYSLRAGTIVASTAGVPFTDLYRDMLLDGVLAQLYLGLGEPEQAQYHEQRFERKFEECKSRERKNAAVGTFNQEYRDC